MSVTRINEFQAIEGKGDALRDLMRSFLPGIESASGCRSCRLLQSRTDPQRIVMLEVWDDVGSHEAATQAIPAAALQEAMALLAGPPKGEYFEG